MTIGELKRLLNPLDDSLVIIVVGTFSDGDGLACEEWFQLQGLTRRVDPDTAEDYLQFDCSLLDVFEPEARTS